MWWGGETALCTRDAVRCHADAGTMSDREVVATMGTLGEQVTCELLEARFVDILGRVKAMAIPLDKPTTDLAQVAADPAVARGVSADGSSVAGYAQIEDSDLHLAPDASTVFPQAMLVDYVRVYGALP